MVSIPCETPFSLPQSYSLTFGVGVSLTESDDTVLFAYGPVMLAEAYCAAEILARQQSLEVQVINQPWLNRLDEGLVARSSEG